MTVTLTPEQERALDAVQGWFLDGRVREQPFRLFGPAGVGKTTLVKHLARTLGISDIAYGAYTGKAASVLTRKGVPATTIHSAIYRPMENAETRAMWREAVNELAELQSCRADPIAAGRASALELAGAISEKSEEVEELAAELRRPGFELNPYADWGMAELIVLDEVSMVNKQMAYDIESFGVPVLVLGDPSQLQPVSGEGHYDTDTPDILLTEIHRQALESPVLALATRIRTSTASDFGIRDGERVTASISAAAAADQVLCWRNETRWKLGNLIRAHRDRPAGVPVAGDKIMCVVNNRKDLGVLNGQQFDVQDVKDASGDVCTLLLRECGTTGPDRWIQSYTSGFRNLAGERELKNRRAWRGKVGAFTFADVITVHKAQGSEWDHVYIIDETAPMMAMTAQREGREAAIDAGRRWAYTAVTRASDAVTLATTRKS
jgi:exodeoxyribonuclease V